MLLSLKNSPHYDQFKDRTTIWEKRIADLDFCLNFLNNIQRKWVYLEPIFGRGSLPSEAARFNRLDVEMRVILAGFLKKNFVIYYIYQLLYNFIDIAKDPRIILLSSQASLPRTLEQISDQLSRCQRALNDFLEVLKKIFTLFTIILLLRKNAKHFQDFIFWVMMIY